MPTEAERFLIAFHAEHPGATSIAMGRLPVRCAGESFESSYALLAARVPADAQRVLDIACGDGFLLSILADSRPRLQPTGLDMSEHELAAAASRLQERARLVQANAQHMPFGDGEFDAAVSHMALMLMDDTARVLAEARRVLSRGGTLAAVLGAPFPSSPPLAAYRALIAPHIANSASKVAIGDARWREPQGIRELLGGAAFSDVAITDVECALVLPPGALWDWLMLMYDAHFVDEETRDRLKGRFLADSAPLADAQGLLRLPLQWRLVEARAA
jgi:SAM-dependent methyltransferase